MLSLSLLNDSVIFVGSGDGRIKKLSGSDTKWGLDKEV